MGAPSPQQIDRSPLTLLCFAAAAYSAYVLAPSAHVKPKLIIIYRKFDASRLEWAERGDMKVEKNTEI